MKAGQFPMEALIKIEMRHIYEVKRFFFLLLLFKLYLERYLMHFYKVFKILSLSYHCICY